MKKKGSSMRQVPWQSWEQWNWVANELFSDSPGRIAAALNRIAAWQSRGNVPVAVEISAGLVAIHQRDSEVIQDGSGNAALPHDLQRMMYAMAIQRLVNGVVDQSQKYATSSVADRAEALGLPRLLVDIRHEAAHGELPGLSLLQVASKQALAWLKLHYWERQRETLKQARATLKSKLVDHCYLVTEILSPLVPATDLKHRQDEGLTDEDLNSNLEVRQQELNRVRKQQRDELFNELLDLSLSSPQDLVSVIVEDGLLTDVNLSVEDKTVSMIPGLAASSNLKSTTDISWKFTLRELSFHMPRLPAMLLVAIIKYISSFLGDGKSGRADRESVTLSHLGAYMTETPCSSLNRLTAWCTWLLGKGVSKDVSHLSGKELRQLKELKIPVVPSVKLELGKELLGELLRLCLRTASRGFPLAELVPLIGFKLGDHEFQQRITALAQLGGRVQGAKWNTDERNESQGGAQITGKVLLKEKLGAEDALPSMVTKFGDNGNDRLIQADLCLGRAKSLQKAFFVRHSSSRTGSQATQCSVSPSSDHSLRVLEQGSTRSFQSQEQETLPVINVPPGESLSNVKQWKIVKNWRPCAIGMIPSMGHCSGIVPSLEWKTPVQQSESVPSEQMENRRDRVTAACGSESNEEKLVRSKRTNEYPGETRKRPKTGLHVRFSLDNDIGVRGKSLANKLEPLQVSIIPNAGTPSAKEQINSGSLVEGCLLQQGALMLVTPDQVKALKASVRIL